MFWHNFRWLFEMDGSDFCFPGTLGWNNATTGYFHNYGWWNVFDCEFELEGRKGKWRERGLPE